MPCVLVEFPELQLSDMSFQTGRGKIPAGGSGLFDDIFPDSPKTIKNRLGDHLRRFTLTKRGRDQIKLAICHSTGKYTQFLSLLRTILPIALSRLSEGSMML